MMSFAVQLVSDSVFTTYVLRQRHGIKVTPPPVTFVILMMFKMSSMFFSTAKRKEKKRKGGVHVLPLHAVSCIFRVHHVEKRCGVCWLACCGLNIPGVWTEIVEFLCMCSNQLGQDGAQTT